MALTTTMSHDMNTYPNSCCVTMNTLERHEGNNVHRIQNAEYKDVWEIISWQKCPKGKENYRE
jgi:hypothetical protein